MSDEALREAVNEFAKECTKYLRRHGYIRCEGRGRAARWYSV